jgi:hypothetical protein
MAMKIRKQSFFLVLTIIFSILILTHILYQYKYRIGRVEEKIAAEENPNQNEIRISQLLAEINNANKINEILKETLKDKYIENHNLSWQIDQIKKERTSVEAAYRTKIVSAPKANSSIDISETNIEPANADFDIKKKNIIFKVQIITSKTRLKMESPHFKNLKDVWEYKNGEIYKYTVGEKLDLNAASNLQSELRKKGFSGAFVVAFKNGKRIQVN